MSDSNFGYLMATLKLNSKRAMIYGKCNLDILITGNVFDEPLNCSEMEVSGVIIRIIHDKRSNNSKLIARQFTRLKSN